MRGKPTPCAPRLLPRLAHPRACGENACAGGCGVGVAGSSPRVRGKRRIRQGLGRGVRLIPARAGKTPGAAPGAPSPAAHPRACGENSRRTLCAAFTAGSSPRVRGKHFFVSETEKSGRLIPARAGKTRSTRTSVKQNPAHPRACGENRPDLAGTGSTGGSSPRARGKPVRAVHPGVHRRLIPARAGKTPITDLERRGPRAHPRARGENDHGAEGVEALGGSSPRARGKLEGVIPATRTVGLIPARAGKTWMWASMAARRRAHPRARGENHRVEPRSRALTGSSPRARGKPSTTKGMIRRERLIPARAGKTMRLVP